MDSTKTEIIIFIQRWIYHAGKSDEKNIFVGADALFDGNQRMYFASEIEYTFVYESIPGLAEASPGDIYRVTAAEEDSAYGHQWRIASADRIESAMVHASPSTNIHAPFPSAPFFLMAAIPVY